VHAGRTTGHAEHRTFSKHLAHAIDKVENHTKAAGEDVEQLDGDSARLWIPWSIASKRLTDSRTYESVTGKGCGSDEQTQKRVKAKEDATRAPVVTVEARSIKGIKRAWGSKGGK
jgi:hypothetical protein